MNNILLNSEQKKKYCQTLISELPPDGSKEVCIRNATSSISSKQMRTRWMWMDEVAKSGLGSDDLKRDVDIRAKWMFARPILLRDNETFPLVYKYFMEQVKGSVNYSEYCKVFSDEYISVSKQLNRRQTAEYLTEFQRYWLDKGVNLTDPSLIGLDLSKF